VESVAISTDEGWYLSELVDFEILGRDSFGRLSLNNLKVNVICLGNGANGYGAGVALW